MNFEYKRKEYYVFYLPKKKEMRLSKKKLKQIRNENGFVKYYETCNNLF